MFSMRMISKGFDSTGFSPSRLYLSIKHLLRIASIYFFESLHDSRNLVVFKKSLLSFLELIELLLLNYLFHQIWLLYVTLLKSWLLLSKNFFIVSMPLSSDAFNSEKYSLIESRNIKPSIKHYLFYLFKERQQ